MFSDTLSSRTWRVLSLTAAVLAFAGLGSTAIASADPVVTITGYPADNETAGTFVFSASEPVAGFECQLDAGPWVACISPAFVSGLGQGAHDFRVRYDLIAPPAVYSWTVDTVVPPVPVIATPTSGTWTNNTQPTISGSAEPLVNVRVFNGTTLLGTTSADGTGAWSFSPASPLADGSYSIRARARDAATNESAYSSARALYVDTDPPAAPTIVDPNPGELTNGEDLVFAGATEPFATVAVSIDSQPAELVTATSAGLWSLDPPTPPADGAHSVIATATDRAGNTGPASNQVTFELESIAPAQPVIVLPTSPLAQADDSITFFGTAEPNSTVALLDGTTQLASSGADVNGEWSVTFNLADGEYSIVAVATDNHANESVPSAAVELTIDTTGPTTTITSQPPAFSNQTDAVFEFTSNEPSVDHECSFDANFWQPCTSAVPFTGLPAGSNQFAVRGTDALGNIGVPSDTYEWTIDLVAPSAPTILAPASPTLTNNVRQPLSGSAEPYATVEVFIDSSAQSGSLGTTTADASTGEWTFAPPADLPQGDSDLTAIATDRAGNVGSASAVLELSVDSVAPTTSIEPGQPVDSVTTRTVPFTADEPNAIFTCSLDGAAFAACASPFVATGSRYGIHTLAVRASDPAGNVETSAKSITWRVAINEPPIQLDPRCSFDRILPETAVTVSRLRAGAVRSGRQAITFKADRAGIARVALVRRGREIRQVSLPVKRGTNVARWRVSPNKNVSSTAELEISTVSMTARRSVLGVSVVIDPLGAALPLERQLKPRAVKCAKPKGARAAALSVVSVRRVGDSLAIRLRSNQLALASLRVSDGFASVQAAVVQLKARRTGEIAVSLPPGLGDRPSDTSIEITAFNAQYARSKVNPAFPRD